MIIIHNTLTDVSNSRVCELGDVSFSRSILRYCGLSAGLLSRVKGKYFQDIFITAVLMWNMIGRTSDDMDNSRSVHKAKANGLALIALTIPPIDNSWPFSCTGGYLKLLRTFQHGRGIPFIFRHLLFCTAFHVVYVNQCATVDSALVGIADLVWARQNHSGTFAGTGDISQRRVGLRQIVFTI